MENVPAPVVEPGTLLVRVERSTISVGTELSGIRASGEPLWRRAVTQPRKARRILEVATSQGVIAARDMVSGALSASVVTGYSAAGTVVEVGAGVGDVHVGDRVACAGAQAAHHAEFIRVPRNLTVLVEDPVPIADASTVTLGAIALQGIRRAAPTLGETIVVIGLGVLGQLTAQMLRANGCRVIGSDIEEDRVNVARSLGMELGFTAGPDGDIDLVNRLTGGIGADGVIITAATSSSDVLSRAFGMTRKKGRVVLVGDVRIEIDRADIYQKELDFLISTSYGPGRYDEAYESHGLDYPVGYVRWTENRNMQEYIRLLATNRVRVDPLVSAAFPLEDAAKAYEAIRSGSPRPILVLLEYPGSSSPEPRFTTSSRVGRMREGRIGVAVVGAGAFAKSTHLPNIRALEHELSLEVVVSHSGPNAMDAARQYGARYSTTDYRRVLDDEEVELIIVATRHNLHATMALQALRAGKHVLVEKPLALTREELEDIRAHFEGLDGEASPILMTGFNRRFSPYGRRIEKLLAGRAGPLMIDYQMNAGYLPPDHWVHGDEGGGRNLGEACHIYDLFTFLTGARATDVAAHGIRRGSGIYGATDNFATTVTFDDGSVATLLYTAMGSPSVSKERMDVYVDGAIVQLDDYKRLTVAGSKAEGLTSASSDKGQRSELEALARAIRDGGDWPIPLWHQLQATEIALQVQSALVATGS